MMAEIFPRTDRGVLIYFHPFIYFFIHSSIYCLNSCAPMEASLCLWEEPILEAGGRRQIRKDTLPFSVADIERKYSGLWKCRGDDKLPRRRV